MHSTRGADESLSPSQPLPSLPPLPLPLPLPPAQWLRGSVLLGRLL